jgi:hypothetical protein
VIAGITGSNANFAAGAVTDGFVICRLAAMLSLKLGFGIAAASFLHLYLTLHYGSDYKQVSPTIRFCHRSPILSVD